MVISTPVSPLGPIDIIRRVGENDIIIMYPTFQVVAPIWRINNFTYGASSLPSPFQPAYDNLLIPFVLLTMNKFTFQCFVPTGIGLEVVPSSVGTLTVDFGNSTMKQSARNKADLPMLALNHWRLHFYSNNVTLPWFYSHDSTRYEACSFTDVTFQIQGRQCLDLVKSGLVWERNITNVTEISIPSTNLTGNNNSPIFVNMTVTSNRLEQNAVCASLSYQILVERDGM